MKIFATHLILLSTFYFSGCSKIDGALDDAKSIKNSTAILTDDAREGVALQIIAQELKKLQEEVNIKAKISYAKTILALFPFQYIEHNRDVNITNSIGWFYSKIIYACINKVLFFDEDELDQMNKIVWSSDFEDLNAFALSLDYIKDSQFEIVNKPVSILDLTFEIIEANQCNNCKLEDMKPYVRENLKFSDEAIVMLQFMQNALSMAGFKGVLREPTYWPSDWGKLFHGLKGDLEFQNILRPGTNQKDIFDATSRMQQAIQIRNFLKLNNIKPQISKEFHKKVKSIQQLKNPTLEFENNNANLLITDFFHTLNQTLNEVINTPIK
jgi:hypothetical protein